MSEGLRRWYVVKGTPKGSSGYNLERCPEQESASRGGRSIDAFGVQRRKVGAWRGAFKEEPRASVAYVSSCLLVDPLVGVMWLTLAVRHELFRMP